MEYIKLTAKSNKGSKTHIDNTYGVYISSKFAQKLKSSDNSKIEKGLKTTPQQNRELMIMLGMLICYML